MLTMHHDWLGSACSASERPPEAPVGLKVKQYSFVRHVAIDTTHFSPGPSTIDAHRLHAKAVRASQDMAWQLTHHETLMSGNPHRPIAITEILQFKHSLFRAIRDSTN